jgi:sugar/nucleoside kinase (ribokinase family)
MTDSADRIDVLVVGEINPDIVVSDPQPAPIFGEVERYVESIALTVGSSSAIFACGAARLGLRVAFFGVVGDDPLGRFMLDALRERGVDVSACLVDPALPTGASVILTSGADRAILTGRGSIGSMNVDAVPDTLLRRARHVHSGHFFLQEASRSRLPGFFEAARARGITTSFDTNWDPAERWEGVDAMLRACDLFFPNATEARKLSGIEDVEEAARALARNGHTGRADAAHADAARDDAARDDAARDDAARDDAGPIVAVKLGAAGALACRAEGPLVRVPAFAVETRDTTGAGDSFNAGFLAAWLEGSDLGECLRWGAAAGALSTRRLGGIDGQPTAADVRAILR